MQNQYVEFNISNDMLKNCRIDRNVGSPKSIAVPEGIVCIGKDAMQKFRCPKLIMPSTLKTIEKRAFKDAIIEVFDFGECKLERIEDYAFERCTARAELPDTVEYIGANCDLKMDIENKMESKIKLPKALKCISAIGINLNYVTEVELQESMIRQDSNLLNWLHSSISSGDWVTLQVFRDGKELYRLVHDKRWRVDSNKYRYIGPQGILYDRYDSRFEDSLYSRCKVFMAAYRLIWPTDLPEDIEKKYRLYVRNNFLALISGKEEDFESIRMFNNAGLITAFRLKQLLENATKKKNVAVFQENGFDLFFVGFRSLTPNRIESACLDPPSRLPSLRLMLLSKNRHQIESCHKYTH
ncbi:MAG: leucine-rich repeat domain-containing protein [Clostridiales bacterium]|nr:leucine-rich repeat domain-containing protein [Clostridiales bacterium]